MCHRHFVTEEEPLAEPVEEAAAEAADEPEEADRRAPIPTPSDD